MFEQNHFCRNNETLWIIYLSFNYIPLQIPFPKSSQHGLFFTHAKDFLCLIMYRASSNQLKYAFFQVIVKASSGPRYVVACRSKVDKEKLIAGTRVVLDMTTLTIMRTLPREVYVSDCLLMFLFGS